MEAIFKCYCQIHLAREEEEEEEEEDDGSTGGLE